MIYNMTVKGQNLTLTLVQGQVKVTTRSSCISLESLGQDEHIDVFGFVLGQVVIEL